MERRLREVRRQQGEGVAPGGCSERPRRFTDLRLPTASLPLPAHPWHLPFLPPSPLARHSESIDRRYEGADNSPSGTARQPSPGAAATTQSGRFMQGGAMPNVVTKSTFMSADKDFETELLKTDQRKKWGLEPKPVCLPKRGTAALSHPESLLMVRQAGTCASKRVPLRR
jgi:hypothetical protein